MKHQLTTGKRKSKSAQDTALPDTKILRALNSVSANLLMLTKISNNPDSIVEVAKLLVIAEMVSRIVKSLF